jgi:hypothetical protein
MVLSICELKRLGMTGWLQMMTLERKWKDAAASCFEPLPQHLPAIIPRHPHLRWPMSRPRIEFSTSRLTLEPGVAVTVSSLAGAEQQVRRIPHRSTHFSCFHLRHSAETNLKKCVDKQLYWTRDISYRYEIFPLVGLYFFSS